MLEEVFRQEVGSVIIKWMQELHQIKPSSTYAFIFGAYFSIFFPIGCNMEKKRLMNLLFPCRRFIRERFFGVV